MTAPARKSKVLPLDWIVCHRTDDREVCAFGTREEARVYVAHHLSLYVVDNRPLSSLPAPVPPRRGKGAKS